MSRERLANRRGGENLEFATVPRPGVEPIHYTATCGYHPDGRLAEVFLRAGKAGTDLAIQSQETAIAVSMALQFGCPLETLRGAMPRSSDGKPEGAIGALLDLLANTKDMGWS
ncbi:MAG: hypothetical protein EHM35_02270 [Planctomycetaceae bacterium]|nr:MAG: hypothetical protein EHM35_02270 [Planctomycetaceae bacterium]